MCDGSRLVSYVQVAIVDAAALKVMGLKLDTGDFSLCCCSYILQPCESAHTSNGNAEAVEVG